MASDRIREISGPYGNFMRNPVTGSARVCRRCFGFKRQGYELCVACSRQPQHRDAVSPITYSLENSQMHHALRGYKDDHSPAVRRKFTVDLTNTTTGGTPPPGV